MIFIDIFLKKALVGSLTLVPFRTYFLMKMRWMKEKKVP